MARSHYLPAQPGSAVTASRPTPLHSVESGSDAGTGRHAPQFVHLLICLPGPLSSRSGEPPPVYALPDLLLDEMEDLLRDV